MEYYYHEESYRRLYIYEYIFKKQWNNASGEYINKKDHTIGIQWYIWV